VVSGLKGFGFSRHSQDFTWDQKGHKLTETGPKRNRKKRGSFLGEIVGPWGLGRKSQIFGGDHKGTFIWNFFKPCMGNPIGNTGLFGGFWLQGSFTGTVGGLAFKGEPGVLFRGPLRGLIHI